MSSFQAPATGGDMRILLRFLEYPIGSIMDVGAQKLVGGHYSPSDSFGWGVEGADLTNSGATPTGGTISTIDFYNHGVNFVGRLTVGVATPLSFVDIDDSASVLGVLSGNDTLTGDAGDDYLLGGGGTDVFAGNGGDDIFAFETRPNAIALAHTIDGGAATDTITADRAAATPGILDLRAATLTSIERLEITGGARVIVGGSQIGGGQLAANLVVDGGGNGVLEVVRQAAGTSNLATLTLQNFALGTLFVDGSSGADLVYGNSTRDVLIGNDDRLNGGGGNDRLSSGSGRDYLTGGAGADTFRYIAVTDSTVSSTGRDTIYDFTRGQDKIDLSAIDANGSAAGLGAFRFIGGAAFIAGVQGQVRLSYANLAGTANDKTYIFADLNGDRVPDFAITLTGLKALTATDFLL